jgi:DNA replication protein
LLRGLRAYHQNPEEALNEGLERAVARGTLLRVAVRKGEEEDEWYFLNTDKGRRTVERFRRGEIAPEVIPLADEVHLAAERPNIFVLYEQNVGLLQPIIAEELREAEQTYPAEWIEEAFQIAAELNKRNWRYVRAILERWVTEGKDDEKRARDYREDGRRYLKGKYTDRIQH